MSSLPQVASADEAKRKSQVTDGDGSLLPEKGALEFELERLQKNAKRMHCRRRRMPINAKKGFRPLIANKHPS